MVEETGEKNAQELFAPAEQFTSTRDRITATALNMFYEQGFHAVGLDRVIREVGVTKTTFYNHFESKDDLMIAAIQMRDRWESQSFGMAVEKFSDGTPRGTILAIFDVLDHWFNDPDYMGCLFITACAEFPSRFDPVHDAAAKHYGATSDFLKDLCEKAGVQESEAVAKQIDLLIEGAVVMRMIKCDNTTAVTAKAVAEGLLEKHLAS
ncbi:TetR/AcrR family transcriptional regulator [Poriferisphaera sp. WC338]|uniref:TetR/AcrR family transcriptional regulator n=1 Tax=Poriferisphaera sp. WC338 TaxID=3425129 RepID=UPI003D81B640